MGEIKINGGKWRGRKIHIKNSCDKILRPSTARVRQVLFDWLDNFDILKSQYQVGDFFCGSGILGIEALARGITKVDFIDNNKNNINKLIQNLNSLSIKDKEQVISYEINYFIDDVHSYLAKTEKFYNLVFCDPQYFQEDYQHLLEILTPRIIKNGCLYLETGEDLNKQNIIDKQYWQLLRYKKVSASHLHLLNRI